MNILKNDNSILNIIKYGPILFVLIFSFVSTEIILYQKKKNFDNEIKRIETTYLDNNKQRVQEEVERVFDYIKEEKENAEVLLKKEIKNRVYEAFNIATNIYTQESMIDEQGHSHSKEHIFRTIKNTLGGIIYNKGRGYFFIDDINGIKLLQPLNKEFEGKNLINFEDAKGYKLVEKIVQTIKDKSEAYDSYYWYKAGNKETAHKKISFYKYFEPFNVAIGTGEYVEDYENELKQKILEKINKIRYGSNGYIFIFDLEGKTLAHYNKDIIGENRINITDKNGNYVIKNILNLAKDENSGFLSYTATTDKDTALVTNDKISYVKLFKDWNWTIGSGFYLDNLNDQIEQRKELLKESNKQAIEQIVYTSLLITFIFIIISFYISKMTANRFNQYKIDIEKEVENTIEKEKLLVQQSKMATMGEMIGNIAHQWKQPLSLISTSNGLVRLNKEYNNFSEDEVNLAITSIDNSVKNLSNTIDDFKNFFNPNKEIERFSLSEAFEKTFKLISSEFKNNNIEIIKDIEDTGVYGLENELLQILINILKNAKDELVKKHDRERRLIFINTYEEGNNFIIKIKDNAYGIPNEIINSIFDAYFTTKEEKGGTGIGLYMCKQIIESMDGKIEVLNALYEYEGINYKGAEFKITLKKTFED